MDTPKTFNEERAGAAMLLMRDLKKAMIKKEQVEADEQSEVDAIKAYYKAERDKAEKEINEIKLTLASWVDRDNGEKSYKTSLGRIGVKTSKTGSWKVPTTKGFLERIPDEFKIETTVVSANSSALKEATSVTSDGKVIFNETGEVLEGVVGTPAGKETITITPEGSFRDGVKAWAKKK